MQKFVPWYLVRILATNAPDPHHWTLNSCFGAFLSVRVHFGPFRYCTKHGAKRAKLVQLMQKFVQRCLIRIFQNERSRSTPLDPKLMFWCVSFCLGAFGTVSLLHKTCCKTRQTVQLMQKFVPWCLVRIYATNAPDPHHSSLRSSFGVFLSVRVHFGPFRYCTKHGAKRAKLVQLIQKLLQRCLVRIFRNERSQSKPLDPKLMFWFVSFRLGAFGTVSLLHKTCCKTRQTGAINAKV